MTQLAIWQQISVLCLPLYVGNGVCGCNGNCTCDEGFSGEICECRSIQECRKDPLEEEVSSPSVYTSYAVTYVSLTPVCSFALDVAVVCVVCAPVTQVMPAPTARCAPQQR